MVPGRMAVAWSHRSIPSGAHDSSDRLLIPEKLYGREHEIDALLAAFDRVVAQGTPELVLVSGYSGVGKSSVVSELHKALVPRAGFSRRASSTSTSATFPTRHCHRLSRPWSVRSSSRAKQKWTSGGTPFGRRWDRTGS